MAVGSRIIVCDCIEVSEIISSFNVDAGVKVNVNYFKVLDKIEFDL